MYMFNGDVQVTGSGAAVVVVVVVASVEGRSVVVSPPPQAVGAAIEESKKIVSDLKSQYKFNWPYQAYTNDFWYKRSELASQICCKWTIGQEGFHNS